MTLNEQNDDNQSNNKDEKSDSMKENSPDKITENDA